MADPMLGAPLHNKIFAGNRAVGRVAFTVAAGPGGSRRERVHEAGSLRVRFPNGDSKTVLDAVIVNTGGGMTGGDRFDVDIKVGPGGALAWLPQETIVFDQARLRRSIDIELARDGNLLLAEAAVFGRSAMGEAVVQGHFFDRWRVHVGGALVFAETLRLDGDIAHRLAQRAIAGGGGAVASVIKYPGSDADAAAVRAMQDHFAGEVGVSAWNRLVVARLVAADGAALRRDLVAVLGALDAAPLPRLWLN